MEEQEIEESLISFETAKLAQEKGFDLKGTKKYWCNYYTGQPINKWKLLPFEDLHLNFMEFPAYTQSLLQKWLREIHNIDVRVANKYRYYHLVKDQQYFDRKTYDTYEQALEVGLLEGLKLIKINNE